MFKIEITEESCDGCGSCVEACPMEVLVVRDDHATAEQPEQCMCCRVCEVDCPNEAIKIYE